jgi:Domain of unknown function (DUF4136)
VLRFGGAVAALPPNSGAILNGAVLANGKGDTIRRCNLKLLRTLITASVLLLPALASAQDVKIDFDKAYNFSGPKTYAISIGTTWGNDLSQRRVLTEIDQEIASKGWKKVDPAQADIVVVLHGATQTKHNVNTFYSGMGGYGYRYGGFGGTASAQTVVSEYAVGTVVVDMFDAKSKNLVFRGTAEDEISDNAEKNAKRLDKASTKLFKNFPPTANK